MRRGRQLWGRGVGERERERPLEERHMCDSLGLGPSVPAIGEQSVKREAEDPQMETVLGTEAKGVSSSQQQCLAPSFSLWLLP